MIPSSSCQQRMIKWIYFNAVAIFFLCKAGQEGYLDVFHTELEAFKQRVKEHTVKCKGETLPNFTEHQSSTARCRPDPGEVLESLPPVSIPNDIIYTCIYVCVYIYGTIWMILFLLFWNRNWSQGSSCKTCRFSRMFSAPWIHRYWLHFSLQFPQSQTRTIGLSDLFIQPHYLCWFKKKKKNIF